MVGKRHISLARPLNYIAQIQTHVCNGYISKRWSVASALTVTSHEEWTWFIHFQFLRLWKSVFLIICGNWGICIRWVVGLSQLLNRNFKFYNPCILGSKEKQIKEIQLHFKGEYNFFRKSYIYEWNKRTQVIKQGSKVSLWDGIIRRCFLERWSPSNRPCNAISALFTAPCTLVWPDFLNCVFLRQ